MTSDEWSRATFAGTERAQAEVVAALTVDERLALLEELLAIAEASGALQRARDAKQRAIDELWGTRATDGAREGHARPSQGSRASSK